MSNSKTRLELHFGEEKPAYRSDQVLSGWVLLDYNIGHAYLRASKFCVECLGFWEAIELHATSGGAAGSHRRHRREHLSLRQDILPANQVLESRRYDFRFRLPSNLPHSIECDDVGFIRYCCRAVLEDSTSSSVLEAISYFSLIEEIDLNSHAVREVCRPTEQVSANVVCKQANSANKSGDITALLVLSESAYVPGESVQCAITLTSSTVGILLVEQALIRLVQTVTALGENGRTFSGSQGASRSSIIAENPVQTGDEQYSQQCWMTRCQLHIPGTVVTSLLHVRSTLHPLAVSYEVEFYACLNACAAEISVRCPVLIGTQPSIKDSGSKPRHSAALQPAIVEISRCIIAESDHPAIRSHHHHQQQQQSQSRTSSLISQLSLAVPGQSARRKSSIRSAAPISYSLYCVYYPMLSLIRRQRTGLKSILKRHSTENFVDASGSGVESIRDQDQLELPLRDARLRTSSSWYETPL